METPFDLPEPETPEEAVIARYQLSGDQYGSCAEWEAILDAERAVTVAVEEIGVGEVDGNEFGGGEAVLYAYGADAAALFKLMEPTPRGLAFKLAHVVLRQGVPGDGVPSGSVTLYGNEAQQSQRPTPAGTTLSAACMTSDDRSL
ncbi:hypothetical protein [Streptomyces sp. NPDC088801]|uniref:hypothetical protein n=1 Tax=Streptomyces sp. NPDC088801 TaxID=3365903 RepID=UPI0037F30ECE